MNVFYIVIYLVSLCLLVGCGFGLMYSNIQSINRKPVKRHPEAPEAGEEVMYVDVSTYNQTDFQATKDKLEDLYND